jgi:uncharacterized protein YhhL (DUF1145 family)
MKKILLVIFCLASITTFAQTTVSPTWGQSFEFALKSNYTIYVLAGLVLLAAAAFVLLRKDDGDPKTDEGFLQKYKVIFFGVLVAFACVLFYSKPGTIKFQNEKTIEDAAFLKYYQDQDKNLRTFWDSLYNSNRLIGAAKN